MLTKTCLRNSQVMFMLSTCTYEQTNYDRKEIPLICTKIPLLKHSKTIQTPPEIPCKTWGVFWQCCKVAHQNRSYRFKHTAHRLNRADFPLTALKTNLAYRRAAFQGQDYFYVLYIKHIYIYIHAGGDGPCNPHKVSSSPPPPTESNSFHPPLSLKRERMKKTRER